MSGETTRKMIDALLIDAPAPMFLSTFFRSPPQNYHDSEEVEFDIQREDEEVAVAIQDLSVGARNNEASRFTNKTFKPPIFSEKGTITGFDLIKRQIGDHPFQDPRYQAAAMNKAGSLIDKLNRKIRRSIELMASQVLQTGVLDLVDDSGTTIYTLDFKMKATHLVTVTATWATDGSTGDPIADLQSLAEVVRKDGKREPTDLVYGSSAWLRFLANGKVKDYLNFRRATLAEVAPARAGAGATKMGTIWIGDYPFNMWTYKAEYKHPNTGTLTSYVSTDNVIMLGDGARLDLTYGGIPVLGGAESRALDLLPRRLSDGARGIDVITNAWLTEGGEHLAVKVAARPLTIPSEIDSFARLDVTA
jgi:hypothetical protein